MKRSFENVCVAFGPFVVCVMLFALGGCAQNVETPMEQKTKQVTPTSTDQDAATQGSYVYIHQWNGPGLDKPADVSRAYVGSNGIGAFVDSLKAADGSGMTEGKADNIAVGNYIIVTTGGTTPSLSGTTTGTATQTPTGSQTVSPIQDVRSRVSAAIPVAVAPGGIAQPTATAGAGEGEVTSTTDNEAQGKWAQLEAAKDQMQAALDAVNALMQDAPVPTTQPAE